MLQRTLKVQFILLLAQLAVIELTLGVLRKVYLVDSFVILLNTLDLNVIKWTIFHLDLLQTGGTNDVVAGLQLPGLVHFLVEHRVANLTGKTTSQQLVLILGGL